MLKQAQLDYCLCSTSKLIEIFPERTDFCRHFLSVCQNRNISRTKNGVSLNHRHKACKESRWLTTTLQENTSSRNPELQNSPTVWPQLWQGLRLLQHLLLPGPPALWKQQGCPLSLVNLKATRHTWPSSRAAGNLRTLRTKFMPRLWVSKPRETLSLGFSGLTLVWIAKKMWMTWDMATCQTEPLDSNFIKWL